MMCFCKKKSKYYRQKYNCRRTAQLFRSIGSHHILCFVSLSCFQNHRKYKIVNQLLLLCSLLWLLVGH